MSSRIVSLVLAYFPAKGSDLIVALALAHCANESGRASCNVAELSSMTRLSTRHTQRKLAAMCQSGWGRRAPGAALGLEVRSVFQISPAWLENPVLWLTDQAKLRVCKPLPR